MRRSQKLLAGMARVTVPLLGREGSGGARLGPAGSALRVFSKSKTTAPQHPAAASGGEASDRGFAAGSAADAWPGSTSVQVGAANLQIHTASLREIADGAAVVSQGGTQMMAAVVVDPNYNLTRMFHKLEISYRERACAFGKIPATFSRRETAPREAEIAVMGLLEQIFRPLLPSGYSHDTILDTMLLSREGRDGAEPHTAAINAVSAALTCSKIPWGGPVAAIQVAVKDGKATLSPSAKDREGADGVLLYVGTEERAVMLTGQAKEVDPEHLAAAVEAAQEAAGPLIAAQRRAAESWDGRMSTLRMVAADASAMTTIQSLVEEKVEGVIRDAALGTMQTARALRDILQDLRESLVNMGYWRNEMVRVEGSGTVSPNDMELGFKSTTIRVMKRLLKEEGLRPDGRGPLDSREHSFSEGILPGVHGSSLVHAGEGQALATVTVGGADDRPYMDSTRDDGQKGRKKLLVAQFGMAMPLEAYRGGAVVLNRRQELLNAAMLESALLPVLPDPTSFPFAVRLNVELLGVVDVPPLLVLRGASSALQSVGVPILRPVGGACVGIVDYGEGAGFELLDDVSDLEEQLVEMELQVAGTERGFTAIHAACQERGVPAGELIRALRRAGSRLTTSLSQAAQEEAARDSTGARPVEKRVANLAVQKEHVGRVIGSGGSTVKSIEEETGAKLVIGDDGVVHLFAMTSENLQAAIKAVKDCLPTSLNEGETYTAKVVSIKDFGAFVEFQNSKIQALLHVSELADKRVKAVTDVVNIGDEVNVVFLGHDKKGNMRISRKAALATQASENSS